MAEHLKKETVLDDKPTGTIELINGEPKNGVLLPPALSSSSNGQTFKVDEAADDKGSCRVNDADSVAAKENGEDSLATRSDTSALQAPVKPLSPFQQTQFANTEKLPAQLISQGLIRHRIVLGACFLAALGILALGAVNLDSVFRVDAQTDKTFKIHYREKKPALPPNLSYVSGEYLMPEEKASGLYQVIEGAWGTSLYGLVNEHGDIIVKPAFGSIGYFHDGLASFSVGTKSKTRFGYIDKTGKEVIKPDYKSARDFDHGSAAVCKGDKTWQLINRKGKVIIEVPTEGDVVDLDGVYSVRQKNGKTGLINGKGDWLIPAKYDGISKLLVDRQSENNIDNRQISFEPPEKQDVYKISLDGRCGIINRKGEILIPPQFENILAYNDQHILFEENNKYGFADLSGKTVIAAKLDFATTYDDLIAVQQDGKWRFIDSAGNTVSGVSFDGVNAVLGAKWMNNGRGCVIIGDLFGYVNNKGLHAIKPTYKWAVPFRNGFAEVWDGRFWKYIDPNDHSPLNGLTYISEIPDGKEAANIAFPGVLGAFTEAKTTQDFDNSLKAWVKYLKRTNTDNDLPDSDNE